MFCLEFEYNNSDQMTTDHLNVEVITTILAEIKNPQEVTVTPTGDVVAAVVAVMAQQVAVIEALGVTMTGEALEGMVVAMAEDTIVMIMPEIGMVEILIEEEVVTTTAEMVLIVSIVEVGAEVDTTITTIVNLADLIHSEGEVTIDRDQLERVKTHHRLKPVRDLDYNLRRERLLYQ